MVVSALGTADEMNGVVVSPALPDDRIGVIRRRVRSTAVALLTSVIALSTSAAPVAANHTANCSEPGGAHNRWSGVALAGQKHGAAANLEGQSLDMCANPDGVGEASASFAFVNVVGTGSYDIAQTGVGRCRAIFFPDCTWNMEVIATYGRNDSTAGCAGKGDIWPLAYRRATYDGATWDYKVTHINNQWLFFRGGTQILSMAESAICWTPTAAQWFGESHDFGDAIGGNANHYFIKGMNYSNAEGGGFFWTSFNAAKSCGLSAGAPFFCDIVNGTQIDIWTSR